MHTILFFVALEYNAPPFEYLSNVLKRCPVKEQLIVRVKVSVFKLWITTLQSGFLNLQGWSEFNPV